MKVISQLHPTRTKLPHYVTVNAKKTPGAWPLTGVDTEDSRQFAHTQIEMQNKFRLAALYEISWNFHKYHKLPSISTVIWH